MNGVHEHAPQTDWPREAIVRDCALRVICHARTLRSSTQLPRAMYEVPPRVVPMSEQAVRRRGWQCRARLRGVVSGTHSIAAVLLAPRASAFIPRMRHAALFPLRCSQSKAARLASAVRVSSRTAQTLHRQTETKETRGADSRMTQQSRSESDGRRRLARPCDGNSEARLRSRVRAACHVAPCGSGVTAVLAVTRVLVTLVTLVTSHACVSPYAQVPARP